MISRYEVNEITKLWSEKNKYETWGKIELLVCEAWFQEKLFDKTNLKNIKKNYQIDLNRLYEIELETKHDVIAFISMFTEKMGLEKKWVHFGLTSTDIVDTAQNYLISQSNNLVEKEILNLLALLKENALKYKKQLIMGRTHGMFAEPTSLGLKFLAWYAEGKRCLTRFLNAKKQIAVVKLSGSVGNFAHVSPQIAIFVSKQLNLKLDPITTQVTSRDRHVELFNAFSQIANWLEKIALEFRHLQRTEINEISEGFEKLQKGSSSMPHKKNPISSENIMGLARLIRSYSQVTYENNLLWHERDISHSSNERIIIPDVFHLIIYSLRRMSNIIENLYINTAQIIQNINNSYNIFYSQLILNEIIKNQNISRTDAYNFIQTCATLALQQKKDFLLILEESNVEQYLPLEYLTKICTLEYFLQNINFIYLQNE